MYIRLTCRQFSLFPPTAKPKIFINFSGWRFILILASFHRDLLRFTSTFVSFSCLFGMSFISWGTSGDYYPELLYSWWIWNNSIFCWRTNITKIKIMAHAFIFNIDGPGHNFWIHIFIILLPLPEFNLP